MGFSSIDDMISEITAGKFQKLVFQKSAANAGASTAGRWHEMFTAAGFPIAGSFSGTAGVATQMTSSTTGALPIGANVDPDTKHLINAALWSPTATVVPCTAVLVDMLLYYPACVVTGTATTLNNSSGLPRYTDGVGVLPIIAVQTALGAASPALTLTYTDHEGNTSQTAPTALTSPGNSAPISTLFIVDGQPYSRLLAGDFGVRAISSYTLASGTTGTVAFILVKPLATIPMLAINTATERDYLYQMPSLPRIYDGACLSWLISPGGAMVAGGIIAGYVDLAWG